MYWVSLHSVFLSKPCVWRMKSSSQLKYEWSPPRSAVTSTWYLFPASSITFQRCPSLLRVPETIATFTPQTQHRNPNASAMPSQTPFPVRSGPTGQWEETVSVLSYLTVSTR